VRGFRVAPGTRALVAGTGPLLLPTITALLSAGVEVVAALEANGRGARLRAGLGLLRSPARLREAVRYLRALRAHRDDHRLSRAIRRVHGDGRVERATIARVDRRGSPRPGTEEDLEVDVVCAGFGLQPSIELARLLGCAMRHEPVRGGWLPVHDSAMQTSVP